VNLNTAGWASPLLRLLARLDSDGFNSTTPVTEINGGNISATNADIALVAKGTGATLAQVPDGTIAGGDKRGIYATDLQKVRLASNQVASGSYSFIGGGQRNIAGGENAVIGGGILNTTSQQHSVIAGGSTNNVSGQLAAICGGQSNTASSNWSFVGGGQGNTASTNTHATVCGGNGSTASGQYSFVGGGYILSTSGQFSGIVCGSGSIASGQSAFIGGGENNRANSAFSFISGGVRGDTRNIIGYHVFPACNAPIASAYGSTQAALLLLARQTTDASATVLASDSSAASATNQVTLPNNSAYHFRGSVIAGVTGGGDSKAWTFEGVIKRGATAASTTIVGSVVLNTIAQDSGASAWTIAITANTTLGCITVTVTGAAATTIRWVAKIENTEMTY
jgi:hypothetical protein